MFETAITSSVLIVIILMIRRAFKGRISNTLRYALWLLVAIRLLLPFSLIKSPASVLNLIAKTNTQAVTPAAPSNPNPIGDGYNIALPEAPAITPTAPITPAVTEAHENINHEVPNTPLSKPQATQVTPQKTVKLSPLTVAKVVWLSVIGVMILWYIIANTAFYIDIRRKRQELDCPCKLKVYTVARLKSPCLFGLIKPAVYVTEEAAQDTQMLDYIIAHELCHYRHGDMLWSALRYFLLAVYWFNPLVWAAAFVSKKDCEYACDEAAIKRLGEDKRFDYGKALVAMVPKSGKSTSIFGLASTAMSANGRTLKNRVEFIAKKPKTTVAAMVMTVIIALFSVGCTFTAAQSGEPSRGVTNSGKNDIVNTDTAQGEQEKAPAENIDKGSSSYKKTVYWQTGDDIAKMSTGFFPGILQAGDDPYSYNNCYYAENGELTPVTFQRNDSPKFISVYGEEDGVVYLCFKDDSGEIKADTVFSTDYVEVGRYGSLIYFSDDNMLYCYDTQTGEITKPLPSAPFGFSFEEYSSSENPSDYNETVTWYTGIRQIGDKLYYRSDKSVSPDGSKPAYECGLWSYNMASGEESRICRFGGDLWLCVGFSLIDQNTLLIIEETEDGYLYHIIDLSLCEKDELIDLTKLSTISELKARGMVKNTLALPQQAWHISSGEIIKYLYYINGEEMTIIEIATLEKHIFKTKSELYPNYTGEHDGRIVFHNRKDDYALYVLDTNDDTITLFKNQPGERQFFQDFIDGEIRVSIHDSETNELIRYEGIRFTSN